MKIAFVVPDGLTPRGGNKRIVEYASRLGHRGHDVYILTSDKSLPDWLKGHYDGFKLVNIDRYRRFVCDVAVATGGRSARRLGRMTKAKVKAYSVVMLESLNKPTEKNGKKIDRDRFLADPYEQNWLYYSNSSWMKNIVEEQFGQQCHLILAPTHERMVPSESFKPEGKIWVLGYGNGDWKGGQRTADAVALAKKSIPNLEMVHYSQRSRPRSRALVKHWSCPDQELLPKIYSSADIFVHSSKFEGFANTCFEAINCGTPVISYDTPGVEDIVLPGKTGVIVKDGYDKDSETFHIIKMARAIVNLVNDPAKLDLLRAGCLEHAATFSWEDTLSKLEQMFEQKLETLTA